MASHAARMSFSNRSVMQSQQAPTATSHASREECRLSIIKEAHDPTSSTNKPASEDVVERILKATDPNVRSIPVYFDYKKEARTYKFFSSVGTVATHFSLDGLAIRKVSPEAIQQQEDRQRRQRETEEAAKAELNPDQAKDFVSTKILKNQFNYSDRGSQTMNNPIKNRSVVTDPPPAILFGAMATAWAIYDAYEADRLQNEKASAVQRKVAAGYRAGKDEDSAFTITGSTASFNGEDAAAETPGSGYNAMQSKAFAGALKIMERMVNQNDCFDIIDDFKFWEDQSDLYKEEGTLLPLWQFYTERSKKRSVTCIAQSNKYIDFFAVGYGSYDFQKLGKGSIHCFTLKNAVPTVSKNSPSAHPEYSFLMESGVLSLAFHPIHSHLLACGLYDGAVCVFDLHIKDEPRHQKPIYSATVRTGKHTEPVWQLYWLDDPSVLSFNSISTDGRLTNWQLHKKELVSKDIMILRTDTVALDPEGMLLNYLRGMCMDQSPVYGQMVVGTQEGVVMLCTANVQNLERFEGHNMAVYTVSWNPYHPDVFISCSEDWTIKLWLKSSAMPLLTFDVGDAVGDVAWAPYSSTVFAAVTSNGKVIVFDLNQNKTEPLCVQTVVKNAKLTHVAFNRVNPILLVGDSRGTVLILKLSPNLRKRIKPAKGERFDDATLRRLEMEKLARLIDITLKDRVLLGMSK
ncbi:unnamed protein product [Phytomonas sp. Hart1]|nr:unnamed protein product [Phytomonas sp. Hart1]|eukprot:CCW66087.1 unnamed protein product [Phytomonas sp. isolate Hart1]